MDNWVIDSNELKDNRNEFLQSIFAIGNGYMAARGLNSFESRKPNEQCTYIAGLFDYFDEPYTDMVNTPNYLKCRFYINNELISFNEQTIMDRNLCLNMKEGTLFTKYRLKTGNRSIIEVTEKYFMSLTDTHKCCVEYQLKPINFSGDISFETGIDYNVSNSVIHDDQTKEDIGVFRFLDYIDTKYSDDKIGLHLRTKKTTYDLVESFTCISEGLQPRRVSERHYEALRFDTFMNQEERVIFHKYISVFTSRDIDVKDTDHLMDKGLQSLENSLNLGYEALMEEQIQKWNEVWYISNVTVSGNQDIDKKLRYHIFQLIQNNASDSPHVNIGARGLTHGRYKGCYFWDTEIFMLPFYLYTNPEAAKNLLLYRYSTLDDARYNAIKQNVSGARYPWMCTINGVDQCDTWDIGLSEIHITADIAYAVQHYYEVTGDIDFIRNYGLEMLIETARYWCSRFTYDASRDCYNLLWVKGPNEYGGVTVNNTYTVMMACFNIQKALDWIEYLSEKDIAIIDKLAKRIKFDYKEIDDFKNIINKSVILYDESKKLYIEDEHFMEMEPINLKEVKLDDIALYKKICFDRLQRYQVVKQADIILLMLLLPHRFNAQEMQAAWNFYEPLTTHDSSLSFATHAQMAARIKENELAKSYLYKSISLDYDNIMDNTHKEGLHLGALGGTWLSIISGFAGIYLKGGQIHVEPNIPEEWGKLSFKLYLKSSLVQFKMDYQQVEIKLLNGNSIDLIVEDESIVLSYTEIYKKFL